MIIINNTHKNNFDEVTGENTKEHIPNWSKILDHSFRILIIKGSGSGRTKTWLNLINRQSDIDKMYSNTKDSYEAKYQVLINKQQSVGLIIVMTLKHLLNTLMIWVIFIKMLISTIQEKTKNNDRV